VTAPVLAVRDLSVTLHAPEGEREVVRGISFDLYPGERLALVGESGCGKTKAAEAIMGLLPREAFSARAAAVDLAGQDLFSLTESGMRRIRGREISMIFQEPRTALDPVFTIGSQLSAVYRRHRGQSRGKALESSMRLLQHVGLADARRLLDSYPHQLSGGMRQRVMVAMAMACKPKVLVADEPTTALDVTTQAQVLNNLRSLGAESGTAILLITHDLGVVAHYCDRALVMRDGRIVEQAAVRDLFSRPQHRYSAELLAACKGTAA
jgi:ABC-type dipeptide/oligopeptide/nickel transport system ATPase component